MPYARRRTKARKVRRLRKKKTVASLNKSVSFTRIKGNKVFPASMTIKQKYFMQGYIPASVTSGYFDVYLNSANDALDTGYDFVNAVNNVGVLLNSGVVTQNAQGTDTLQSIYLKNRTLASRITVQCNPLALSDTVYIVIVPFLLNVGNPLVSEVAYYPNQKTRMCNSNYASQGKNTLSHSMSVAKFMGVSSSVVNSDDKYVSGAGTFPDTLICWRVLYYSAAAQTTSNRLVFKVNLTNTTRFEGLKTDNSY